MTEKRFNMEYVHGNTTIWHITDCGEHIPDEKLCDLLNELNDENEQLKKQLASINQLIDNKIDEFKKGDYGDLPCNTIHMFLDLKQEIGD